jgi:streptogramin lyase
MPSWVRAVCLGFTLIGLSTCIAQAQVVTEFSAGISPGSAPEGITAGPDGNLWFTEYWGNRIGRITPLGVVTEFSGTSFHPDEIRLGQDGNLWYAAGNAGKIGRITPLGVITEFNLGVEFVSIALGPDGNWWITESVGRIGRFTPAGVLTEFTAGISAGAAPYRITAGPDGNLWFTETAGNRIGRITPLGVVTEFSAGITANTGLIGPAGITAGPDGNVWFVENGTNLIGRITPLGVVTEFGAGIIPGAFLWGITAGPDGNLWFTEGSGRIGRITPLGVVTEFGAGITAGAQPKNIVAGPDGNLWFTEHGSDRIGRITTGLAAMSFFTLGPCRVVDTRNVTGPALAAGAMRSFVVTGTCGIPAGAVSLSMNVTITEPTSAGALLALPGPLPVVAFQAGTTRANNAFLLLATDGSGALSFSNDMPTGTLHLIVDVNGWWQ